MFSWELALDTACALAVLPGVYFILYKFSGERLVGSGDWLLALSLALMACGAIPAFSVLLLSNLLGSLLSIPAVLRKKKDEFTAKVSFGPLLIAGFLIVFFLQDWLVGLLVV